MWRRPTGPTASQNACGSVWLVLHGGLDQFPGERLVVPPYIYEGRGSNGDTHHTSTLHLPLEFLLELRVVLGSLGVEVLRRGAGNGALLQIVPLRE